MLICHIVLFIQRILSGFFFTQPELAVKKAVQQTVPLIATHDQAFKMITKNHSAMQKRC